MSDQSQSTRTEWESFKVEVERDLAADAVTNGAVSTTTLPTSGDSISN